MNSNNHPSAYGYVPPDKNNSLPPNLPAQEGVLNTGRVEIERKSFYIALKENPRGRLLRITEQSGNRHTSIIIPAPGLKQFQQILADMLEVEANAAMKKPI